MNDLSSQLIQVNHYELIQSVDAFVLAAKAIVKRAESDGHPGLLAYRFFVNSSEGTAGIVITYANAEAWLAHHRIAAQWDEMSAIQATVKLQHFDLFGPLNDELEAFIADASTKTELVYSQYSETISGFNR